MVLESPPSPAQAADSCSVIGRPQCSSQIPCRCSITALLNWFQTIHLKTCLAQSLLAGAGFAAFRKYQKCPSGISLQFVHPLSSSASSMPCPMHSLHSWQAPPQAVSTCIHSSSSSGSLYFMRQGPMTWLFRLIGDTLPQQGHLLRPQKPISGTVLSFQNGVKGH